MRIVEDKVTAYPPHPLTKGDGKIIFDHLPEEWVMDVDLVRLSTRRYGRTTLHPDRTT